MRYIARRPRPKAMEFDPWDEELSHTASVVHEPDAGTWSGLYDSFGNELHKEREPMGYRARRWTKEVA